MGQIDVERRWETFQIRQTDRDRDLGIRVSRSMKRRGFVL